MEKKFYITTAIDYVNARPHIGHAYEKVVADAIAKWEKQKGKKVFFLTGVDENAQKNVQAAEKEGVSVKEFVDRNTGFFLELVKKLDIGYDKFIRTSAKEHAKVVYEILNKVKENGDIYKAKYEGFYCDGCESYITEKDLVDGKCPEHNKEPKWMSEEAYFFKLSKYKKKLISFIKGYIIPNSRKKEILARLEDELNDLCISRSGVEWGIDFPGDKKYKVYVWIDALINYVSGAKEQWPADVHVIGKGINWFHSVIWPALLMSAGYKLPKTLLVHGYLNVAGRKMSKSLGNVIDPLELLERYPADVLRYALLKCSVYDDSDFSEELIVKRNNEELANKLGNLVSRVSGLIEKYGVEKTKSKGLDFKWKKLLKERKARLTRLTSYFNVYPDKFDETSHFLGLELSINGNFVGMQSKSGDNIEKIGLDIQKVVEAVSIEVENYFKTFELDKVLDSIFRLIDYCNWYIQKTQPWKTRDKKVLWELKGSILKISELLWPFIPETSEKIKKIFTASEIVKAKPLFEKIFENSQEKLNKSSLVKEPMTGIGHVDFSEWQKLDLRVAEITEVEDIEGADKLYKLTLDVGELGERTVVAGLKQHYKKDKLERKKIIYFSNLAPRNLRGIESHGMILAAVSEDHKKVVLLAPDGKIETGSKVS